MNEIIDGKKFSQALRSKVKRYVEVIKKKKGITPGLAVILVGEDPASKVYVRNKGKQTLEAGMTPNFSAVDTTSPPKLLKNTLALVPIGQNFCSMF